MELLAGSSNLLGFANRAIYKDGWKAEAPHRPSSLEVFNYTNEPKTTLDGNPDNDVGNYIISMKTSMSA